MYIIITFILHRDHQTILIVLMVQILKHENLINLVCENSALLVYVNFSKCLFFLLSRQMYCVSRSSVQYFLTVLLLNCLLLFFNHFEAEIANALTL